MGVFDSFVLCIFIFICSFDVMLILWVFYKMYHDWNHDLKCKSTNYDHISNLPLITHTNMFMSVTNRHSIFATRLVLLRLLFVNCNWYFSLANKHFFVCTSFCVQNGLTYLVLSYYFYTNAFPCFYFGIPFLTCMYNLFHPALAYFFTIKYFLVLFGNAKYLMKHTIN